MYNTHICGFIEEEFRTNEDLLPLKIAISYEDQLCKVIKDLAEFYSLSPDCEVNLYSFTGDILANLVDYIDLQHSIGISLKEKEKWQKWSCLCYYFSWQIKYFGEIKIIDLVKEAVKNFLKSKKGE
jgi:hypothetical protein